MDLKEIINLKKSFCKQIRRLVIKVGSSVLTDKDGLNIGTIKQLAQQIATIHQQGKEIILVSSGAIAAGMRKMGLKQRPISLPQQQALAAIGQSDLIHIYEEAFAIYNVKVAQVLLTRDGLIDRQRYLNARHTFLALLRWGIIPIVNENDTVAVEEIKFGDNDFLAGIITAMLEADLLILLTDKNGLYNRDPRLQPTAQRLPVVEKIDAQIEALGRASPSHLGRGGIASKIRVAKDMSALGIPVVIAKGTLPNIIMSILNGDDVGTLFLPQKTQRLRKHWLASLPAKGILIIDAGAKEAIQQSGKSLLPSGIKNVKGQFLAGDPVYCVDETGEKIAIGLVNYNSSEIEKIKGLNTKEIAKVLGYKGYDEIIHRDNLCIFNTKRAGD